MRELPAPAYAVGFVRSYARALASTADMVRRFREASGPVVQRKTDLIFPEAVPERGVPAGAVMLVGVLLAAGAYIGWYQWSGSGNRSVDAVPPLPPRLEQAPGRMRRRRRQRRHLQPRRLHRRRLHPQRPAPLAPVAAAPPPAAARAARPPPRPSPPEGRDPAAGQGRGLDSGPRAPGAGPC